MRKNRKMEENKANILRVKRNTLIEQKWISTTKKQNGNVIKHLQSNPINHTHQIERAESKSKRFKKKLKNTFIINSAVP